MPAQMIGNHNQGNHRGLPLRGWGDIVHRYKTHTKTAGHIEVIEASAGSGKTYTLAVLILRLYLIKQLAISEIVAITFTQAAAGELQERVKKFIDQLQRELHQLEHGQALAENNLLHQVVQASTDAEVLIDPHRRIRVDGVELSLMTLQFRLQQASLSLPLFRISTIHGFVHQLMSEVFWLSDFDDSAIIEGDNYWSAQYLRLSQQFWLNAMHEAKHNASHFMHLFPTSDALRKQVPWSFVFLVKRFAKDDLSSDELEELWCRYAEGKGTTTKKNQVKQTLIFHYKKQFLQFLQRSLAETAADTQQSNRYSFDSLIAKAFNLSKQPNFVNYFRRQIKAVLVDEFQDTDYTQWSFIENCLIDGAEDYSLYLIGDPKQSIYKFRHADLDSYFWVTAEDKLIGQQRISQRRQLNTNYRSDPALISALNDLYLGCAANTNGQAKPLSAKPFADDRLEYTAVSAARNHSTWVAEQDDLAAVSLRIPEGGLSELDPCKTDAGLDQALRWLVKDIQALLLRGQQAKLGVLDDATETEATEMDTGVATAKALCASDILILVDDNNRLNRVREALLGAKIAVNYKVSVPLLETDPAFFILGFLRQVNAVMDSQQTLGDEADLIGKQLAAMLPFLGHDLVELQIDHVRGSDHDDPPSELSVLVERLASIDFDRLWHLGGPYSIWQAVANRHCLANFGRSDVELEAFNHSLNELLLLLQEQWQRGYRMSEFLQQITIDLQQHQSDLSSSDPQGVRIMTVHRAKGLEAAVVFYPFGWRGNNSSMPQDYLHIDADTQGYCLLDEPAPNSHPMSEPLRKLYVALTRARNKLVMYWLPTSAAKTSNDAPLNHLLFSESLKKTISKGRYPSICDELNAYHQQGDIQIIEGHKHLLAIKANATSPFKIKPAQVQPLNQLASTFTGQSHGQSYSQSYGQVWSYTRLARQLLSSGHAEDTEEDRLDGLDLKPDPSESRLDPTKSSQNDEHRLSLSPVGSLLNEAFQLRSMDTTQTVAENEQRIDLSAAQLGTLTHDALQAILTQPSILTKSWHQQVNGQNVSSYLQVYLQQANLPRLVESMVRASLTLSCVQDQPLLELAKLGNLCELRFDLPVNDWNLQQLNDLVAEYPQLPLSAFKDWSIAKGHFSGFIDLLLPLEDEWWIVDYKTNYLGDEQQDYDESKLHQCMLSHHYGWQGLFYAMAMSRWQALQIAHGRMTQPKPIKIAYLFCRGLALQQADLIANSIHDPASTQASVGVYEFDAVPLQQAISNMHDWMKFNAVVA